MSIEMKCNQVTVKNKSGNIAIDWSKPLTGKLTVTTDGERVIIRKTSWRGTETYIASIDESIETYQT